jgi:phage gp36-like protein
MSTNRIAMLKERAEAASKTAREIAQKASDDNRDLTDDERHDYDGAMAALKSVLEGIKTTKADEAVIAQAKDFADSVGVPADGGDIKARAKSLGLTASENISSSYHNRYLHPLIFECFDLLRILLEYGWIYVAVFRAH